MSHAVASVISLDVNPSIALTVNRQEKVLSAQPMNDDAAVVLEGMELKGTQLDVALNAIVGSLLKNGYVDELANSILITVEDDDAARGTRLQQSLPLRPTPFWPGPRSTGHFVPDHPEQCAAEAASGGVRHLRGQGGADSDHCGRQRRPAYL